MNYAAAIQTVRCRIAFCGYWGQCNRSSSYMLLVSLTSEVPPMSKRLFTHPLGISLSLSAIFSLPTHTRFSQPPNTAC